MPSVDARCGIPRTHAHAQGGHLGCVAELLRLGADACYTCPANGETPLHAAARRGCNAAIGMLRAHGAELGARNKEGRTPLLCAVAGGRLETVRLILGLCQDSISWWCERCADTHTPVAGCPLGIKMSSDTFIPKENSKTLLAADRLMQTPAMVAAAGSHAQVLEALVQHSSFATAGGIAAQDKDGCTVLHHAATQNDAACVNFLLTLADVPVGAKDKKKKTALDLATDAGAKDCANALRAYFKADEAKGDALLRELLAEEEAAAGKTKSKKKKKNKAEPATPAAVCDTAPVAEEDAEGSGDDAASSSQTPADAAADDSSLEIQLAARDRAGEEEEDAEGEWQAVSRKEKESAKDGATSKALPDAGKARSEPSHSTAGTGRAGAGVPQAGAAGAVAGAGGKGRGQARGVAAGRGAVRAADGPAAAGAKGWSAGRGAGARTGGGAGGDGGTERDKDRDRDREKEKEKEMEKEKKAAVVPAVTAASPGATECVLLRQNVFSVCLTAVVAASPGATECVLLLQNGFSYYRMGSLTI